MVGYFEIPTTEPFTKEAVVQLAFPIDAWIDNVPMMLLAIAGNCFAYSKQDAPAGRVHPAEAAEELQGARSSASRGFASSPA